MSHISITLTDSNRMAYVPLAALGYALRRAHVLDPLRQVTLPIKTIAHSPIDKIIEAVVLILAGGRATNQIDVLLRPNLGLAQAGGQKQFAQQSTFADTLDAFEADSLTQLRHAFETITQQQGHAPAHDFRTGGLWLDDDLTDLPASRRAQGSTKGYFAGEKQGWSSISACECALLSRDGGLVVVSWFYTWYFHTQTDGRTDRTRTASQAFAPGSHRVALGRWLGQR